MSPHYTDDAVTLYHGDCLDVLRELPDASVDAVCTDPPYGLGFMGKEWDSIKAEASRPDSADTVDARFRNVFPRTGKGPAAISFDGHAFGAWCLEWAAECLRVLKPGGHLLAFGGTRTWHRLACAVEDAGFEVRDSIAWLYGSGFPKSLDVGKAIDKAAGAEREVVGRYVPPNGKAWNLRDGTALDGYDYGSPSRDLTITAPATPDAARWQGWGTALKPAFEPIVVARKPLSGTVAANVLAHGTGALNVDGCRVGTDEDRSRPPGRATAATWDLSARTEPSESHALGRWPANVVLDSESAAELDRQSGVSTSGSRKPGTYAGLGYMGSESAEFPGIDGDSRGASRFFKVVAPDTESVFFPIESAACGDASTEAASTSAGSKTANKSVSSPIGGSGSKPTDPSLPGTRSTTATTTHSTTNSTTSCASPPNGTTTIISDSANSTKSSTASNTAAVSDATPTSPSTHSLSAAPEPSTATADHVPSSTGASGLHGTATSSTPSAESDTHGGSAPSFPTFRYEPKAPTVERPRDEPPCEVHEIRRCTICPQVAAVAHPTVKPLDLMRWLVRLVTPPGGVVLEPFAGSGTTAEACVIEGFRCIAIEREASYLPLIVARLTKPIQPDLFGGAA